MKTEVFNHPQKGRAVRVLESVSIGQVIMSCHVVLVSPGDVKEGCPLDSYPMSWDDTHDCIALGEPNLINHSDEPNVKTFHDLENRIMYVIALRNISYGEELTKKYLCTPWFEVH